MIKMITEEEHDYLQLFYLGIKPTVLEGQGTSIALHLMERYPYTTFHTGSILFFQNHRSKTLFDIKKLYHHGKRFEFLLGNTLGYPPLAVKYYAYRGDRRNPKHFIVGYNGFMFGTNVDHIQEDIEWIDQQYNIPSDLQCGLFVESEASLPYRVQLDRDVDLYEQIKTHIAFQSIF